MTNATDLKSFIQETTNPGSSYIKLFLTEQDTPSLRFCVSAHLGLASWRKNPVDVTSLVLTSEMHPSVVLGHTVGVSWYQMSANPEYYIAVSLVPIQLAEYVPSRNSHGAQIFRLVLVGCEITTLRCGLELNFLGNSLGSADKLQRNGVRRCACAKRCSNFSPCQAPRNQAQ
jgi:hypothetical protein